MVTEGVLNRRASNLENVRPAARANGKRPSNLNNSIQNASKRRARATGSVALGNPRYAAAQAKRRSLTKKSAAAVKISLHASGSKDVEMKDAEVAPVASGSGASSTAAAPITLPKYLARPDYKEISRATIAALDPELKDVPLQYIQEGLETTGPA